MLFEILGLGCGSGPLTGRYFPPVGGFLYFLRVRARPSSRSSRACRCSAARRGDLLDVVLYLARPRDRAARRSSLRVRSRSTSSPLAVLVPLAGIADKTLFLAARAEHYWVTIVCFAFAGNWIAGAKAVQIALWFWAGFSKLNHHFPTVVCVMTSNGPLHALPVAAAAHVPRLSARPPPLAAGHRHGARGRAARVRRAGSRSC